MKKVLFILLYLLPALLATAQNNYAEAIQQGDTAFKKGQYKTAINKYFTSEAFDPSKKVVVNKLLPRCFSQTKLPFLSFLM